jgi:hypothetical protein
MMIECTLDGRSFPVDTGAIYNQQKLEFKPATNQFGVGQIQSHDEAVKSTLNKEAAIVLMLMWINTMRLSKGRQRY